VSENRVLRRIFGPKLEEVAEDCIMRNFITCSPQHVIRVTESRRMRWAEHVARMGDMRNAYRTVVGKPEGKRSLGRRGQK
jgi:hypothetical protein